MSSESAFDFSVEPSELGAFLGGLLVGLVKSEVSHIQADIMRATGRVPTDEEWERAKEGMYREAFARVRKCFPAALQSRLAQAESDLIATVMKLN